MNKTALYGSVSDGVDGLRRLIESNGDLPERLHINHLGLAKPAENLIRASFKDPQARAVLNFLCNQGYYLYQSENSISRLAHHRAMRKYWPAVADNTYAISDDDIVYTYEKALGPSTNRLLVILSALPLSGAETSPDRYFHPYFKSAQKFIPHDTAVLRIADLGSIKGAFYLDTTYLPDNANRITEFIRGFVGHLGLTESDMVLFGISKGGTGAVYHGLRNGWRFIAVDPVISDEYYVEKLGDYHFTTGGLFPETKQEAFGRLVKDVSASPPKTEPGDCGSVVVYAKRSEQFDYISSILADSLQDRVAFLNSVNPSITKHTDVFGATMNIQTTVINALLYGFAIPAGLKEMG